MQNIQTPRSQVSKRSIGSIPRQKQWSKYRGRSLAKDENEIFETISRSPDRNSQYSASVSLKKGRNAPKAMFKTKAPVPSHCDQPNLVLRNSSNDYHESK